MSAKKSHKPDENAALRYILGVIYLELRAHSGDCEHCDDVTFLFRMLQSLCKELKIKIDKPNGD